MIPSDFLNFFKKKHMVGTVNKESGLDFGEEFEKRLPHLKKAAGAQSTHSWHAEELTKNNHLSPRNRNY